MSVIPSHSDPQDGPDARYLCVIMPMRI